MLFILFTFLFYLSHPRLRLGWRSVWASYPDKNDDLGGRQDLANSSASICAIYNAFTSQEDIDGDDCAGRAAADHHRENTGADFEIKGLDQEVQAESQITNIGSRPFILVTTPINTRPRLSSPGVFFPGLPSGHIRAHFPQHAKIWRIGKSERPPTCVVWQSLRSSVLPYLLRS